MTCDTLSLGTYQTRKELNNMHNFLFCTRWYLHPKEEGSSCHTVHASCHLEFLSYAIFFCFIETYNFYLQVHTHKRSSVASLASNHRVSPRWV